LYQLRTYQVADPRRGSTNYLNYSYATLSEAWGLRKNYPLGIIKKVRSFMMNQNYKAAFSFLAICALGTAPMIMSFTFPFLIINKVGILLIPYLIAVC